VCVVEVVRSRVCVYVFRSEVYLIERKIRHVEKVCVSVFVQACHCMYKSEGKRQRSS